MILLLLLLAAGCVWAGPSILPYNGGPIMTRPVTIYSIYYGNWRSDNPTIANNNNLFSGISSTTYWDIVRQYVDGTGAPPSSQITVGTTVIVNGSTSKYGMAWGKNDNTAQIIYQALVQNVFPPSTDAIYYLYTSSDVTVPGLCTVFCGYHSYFTVRLSTGATIDIKYSLIGSPAQCPNGCSLSTELILARAVPTAVADTQSSAQIIIHELAETMTDPIFTGYVNNTIDEENNDVCNSQLANVNMDPNRTLWNIDVNGQHFLISAEYNLKTGLCDMGDGGKTLDINAGFKAWSSVLSTNPSPPPFPPSPPEPPPAPSPSPPSPSSPPPPRPPPPIFAVPASMKLAGISSAQFSAAQAIWSATLAASIRALSVTVSSATASQRRLLQTSLSIAYTAQTYDATTTRSFVTNLTRSNFTSAFNLATQLATTLTESVALAEPASGGASGGASVGLIAGATVGSVAGAALVGSAIWWCSARQSKRKSGKS